MLGLLLLIVIGAWAIYQPQTVSEITADLPVRVSDKLGQLWSIAQDSIQANKYLRAEKALLTILHIDERNASAYNRLGILYAKQRSLADAIECFEIAQSLEPSASSLHNVGLIYYETHNYIKAALAFEQALKIDSELPSRHIAYAKVQEKLGNDKKMVQALEKAVELEPIPQTLNILADAYERTDKQELATNIREKAAEMIIPQGQPKKVKQPRRVVR
jgi:superkiller protein 3